MGREIGKRDEKAMVGNLGWMRVMIMLQFQPLGKKCLKSFCAFLSEL